MLNATITNRIDVTDELMIVLVKPDAGVPDFKPGQYVAIGLPGAAPRPAHFPAEVEEAKPDKIIKRAYSIGSSPANRDHLELYVAVVPEGALTSRLVLLQPGDRLFVTPKITGTFTLDEVAPERNLVFVSTGTGIAPFMAMIRTASTWEGNRTITLVHGVRNSKDLAYREELSSSTYGDRLKYFPIVSRSDAEWNGHSGRVQKLFEDGLIALDPEIDSVFLCGNPAMIDDMEALLTTKNFTVHSKKIPGNLHVEKYW